MPNHLVAAQAESFDLDTWTSWSHVPDNLLLLVFSYLQPPELLTAVKVCKQWHWVGLDDLLWKELMYHYWRIDKSIPRAPGKVSWLSEFKRLYCRTPCVETEVIREHRDQVLHVTFSHNGKMISSCSKDGYVKVWNSTFPISLKYYADMKEMTWKYTQFSQFNETDTHLLVSGVHFGSNSTSGEIVVFNLVGDKFELQCRVLNKPYDVFGTWYNNDYLLSGNIHWQGNFTSCSVLWLNKASQALESEHESVVMRLYKILNVNASSVRTIMVANCLDTEQPSQSETCLDTEQPSQSENCLDMEQPSQSETCPDMEQPSQSETCLDMEQPSQSETCPDMEQPSQSETCLDTEQPSQSETCPDMEQPSQSETCLDMEQPSQSENCLDMEQPSQSENCLDTEQLSQSETCLDMERPNHDCLNIKQPNQAEEQLQETQNADVAGRPEPMEAATKDIQELCDGAARSSQPPEVDDLSRLPEVNDLSQPPDFSRLPEVDDMSRLPEVDDLSRGGEMDELVKTVVQGEMAEMGASAKMADSMASDFSNGDTQSVNRTDENRLTEESRSTDETMSCGAITSTVSCSVISHGSRNDGAQQIKDRMDILSTHHVQSVPPSASASSLLSVCSCHSNSSTDTASAANLITPSASADQVCSACLENRLSGLCDKYLIFTMGTKTYTPHQIGIKRIKMSEAAQFIEAMRYRKEEYSLARPPGDQDGAVGVEPVEAEPVEAGVNQEQAAAEEPANQEQYPPEEPANQNAYPLEEPANHDPLEAELENLVYEVLGDLANEELENLAIQEPVPAEVVNPDDSYDSVDHLIELHGHIIGMCLSPDHRYLYVNCRPWPKNYSIEDPLYPPPIAQEIDIHVIDLSKMMEVGTMYRAHKAYTPNDECFFIFLDVSDEYVASGAENKHGYLWDRNYGVCLARYPHADVVNCVAFNPQDPEMLITASDDHSLKIWRSRRTAKSYMKPSTSGDPEALKPSGDPEALKPSGDPEALKPSGDPGARQSLT